MSEPAPPFVYLQIDGDQERCGEDWRALDGITWCHEPIHDSDYRYRLVEGEQWDRLMERARDVLALPVHKEALGKGELLRDLLAYLGETP